MLSDNVGRTRATMFFEQLGFRVDCFNRALINAML